MFLHCSLNGTSLHRAWRREVCTRGPISFLAEDPELVAYMGVDTDGHPHDVNPDQVSWHPRQRQAIPERSNRQPAKRALSLIGTSGIDKSQGASETWDQNPASEDPVSNFVEAIVAKEGVRRRKYLQCHMHADEENCHIWSNISMMRLPMRVDLIYSPQDCKPT